MKSIFIFLLSSFFAFSSFAIETQSRNSELYKLRTYESKSWIEFEKEYREFQDSEKKVGISYLISGSLVVIGSLSGYQTTNDTAVKLVYGVLQGLGLGAVGVGLYKISGNSEWSSFYQALKTVDLGQEQKDQLVLKYLAAEKEKKSIERKLAIATHILAGGLSLYSASREKETSTQSAFYVLAGIHGVLALSYTF